MSNLPYHIPPGYQEFTGIIELNILSLNSIRGAIIRPAAALHPPVELIYQLIADRWDIDFSSIEVFQHKHRLVLYFERGNEEKVGYKFIARKLEEDEWLTACLEHFIRQLEHDQS